MPTSLRIPASATRYDVVQLGGGLDELTPVLRLKPGVLRDVVNFEQSINGGYTRIAGYERYDGRPLASLATYATFQVSLINNVHVGDVVAGVTSGATGIAISLEDSVVAMTKTTGGSFVAGETITVAGVVVGTVVSPGEVPPATSYDARMRALAANVYRADITPAPGSGPIRGGVELNGSCYVWRNNVGGTAMAIWKSNSPAGGWTAVTLGAEIPFNTGTIQPFPGDTLTQGAVTATIRGVSMQGGDWLAGTASGRLVITTPTGGNFAAGAVTGFSLGGPETAITLLPNGRVETDFGNFGSGIKAYGIDGVNRGFEFDGVTYVPIRTGNLVDVPKKVLVHSDHLFFAFGPSLQHSGIGAPFNWTVTAGAAEYRCDAIITALSRQPGSQSAGAMSIATASSTEMLYGHSALDFQKVSFEQSSGARPYGTQRLGGQTLQFGDIGVVSVTATQNYGNFAPSSMTMNIRLFTQARRTLCTASIVNREKSQFRLFFDDKYGLYMTVVNGRTIGSCPVFFPDRVLVTWQTTNALDGAEKSYFGSDSGYVHVLDSGTSHDGVPISAFATLTFANQGNSRVFKRYRGVEFEVQGDGYAQFLVTYEVGYGVLDRTQGETPTPVNVVLSSFRWDEFRWDEFTWDGRSLAPSHCELDGTGENIALRVECNSDAYLPFTINSAIIHYSLRKALHS